MKYLFAAAIVASIAMPAQAQNPPAPAQTMAPVAPFPASPTQGATQAPNQGATQAPTIVMPTGSGAPLPGVFSSTPQGAPMVMPTGPGTPMIMPTSPGSTVPGPGMQPAPAK